MNLLVIFFSFFEFFSFSKSNSKAELELHTKNPVEIFKQSVVNIDVSSFRYSYESPWSQPKIRRTGGTGFIIQIKGEKKILTNAHVVSGAFQIRIRRNGQSKYFFAKVEHIAHDCDLAILDVTTFNKEDGNYLDVRKRFYQNALPLEIGNTPMLNTPVTVIGFPIGGEKISITKGIVSRVDMDTYSHSGVDSHLVVQVDAAINPGNSGGPAIQNGKVIGVAFQILRSGENLGYLIPPPVIKKFLRDISMDGKYDGYIELGVLEQTTENIMIKKALNLPETLKNLGVYVYDILPESSADGYIQKGDVLLEIQGYPITENGEVYIHGEYRDYVEVIDNLEKGETIRVKVLRNQKIIELNFPAKITKVLDFQRKNYDTPPEYLIYGGLVFQPLTSDLMSAYSSVWLARKRSEILFFYYYAIQNRTGIKGEQKVILTKVLPDSGNRHAKEYVHYMLETINGKKVKNLKHCWKLLRREIEKSSMLVFTFYGKKKPLVFSSDQIKKIHKKILNNYYIQRDFFIQKGNE